MSMETETQSSETQPTEAQEQKTEQQPDDQAEATMNAESVQDEVVREETGTPKAGPAEAGESEKSSGEEPSGAEEESGEPDSLDHEKMKRILEGAILAAGEPLDLERMALLFDEADRPGKDLLTRLLEELQADYEDRGVELRKVASGYRFQVRKEYGYWVSRLWVEKPPRYSRALLETLAIIAYRQPITRGEIEEIRGVAVSTNIIKTLHERDWIRVVGHRDVPGRPAMYATTRDFLDYFNLKSLDELPTLSEIRDLDKINEELDLQEKAAGEALAQAAASAGEAAEGTEESPAGDQPRQQDALTQFSPMDEPEVDPADLLADEEVDAVLKRVEATFQRGGATEDEEGADQAPSEVSETQSQPDMLAAGEPAGDATGQSAEESGSPESDNETASSDKIED